MNNDNQVKFAGFFVKRYKEGLPDISAASVTKF